MVGQDHLHGVAEDNTFMSEMFSSYYLVDGDPSSIQQVSRSHGPRSLSRTNMGHYPVSGDLASSGVYYALRYVTNLWSRTILQAYAYSFL
jgi:hypothetical protein